MVDQRRDHWFNEGGQSLENLYSSLDIGLKRFEKLKISMNFGRRSTSLVKTYWSSNYSFVWLVDLEDQLG